MQAKSDGRQKPRPGVTEQRRRLCESAVGLMRQHGSRGVSVSRLCLVTGVSRPTFYRCFEDLDALFTALYSEAVDDHTTGMDLSRIAAEGWEPLRMQHAIEELMNAIFRQPEVAELLFREAADPSSPAFTVVDKAFERITDALEAGLDGEIEDRPGRAYLKSLLAASQWLAHDAIRAGLTPTARREAIQAVQQLVDNALRPYLRGSIRHGGRG